MFYIFIYLIFICKYFDRTKEKNDLKIIREISALTTEITVNPEQRMISLRTSQLFRNYFLIFILSTYW